jgi:hypothetical protein
MPTVSALGTVTWIDPEYYINYDSNTGVILSIGSASIEYPSIRVETDFAVKCISGEYQLQDYKVVKTGEVYSVENTIEQQIVNVPYLVKAYTHHTPAVTIIRNNKKKLWNVVKLVDDPVFLFVTKSGNYQHYIRTLSITDPENEFKFVYDLESNDVEFYVKAQHSKIEFIDE